MSVHLDDYQIDALNKMKNGCILCGKVGSGKSRTALAYYIQRDKRDLYVITTAKKRDDMDWEAEFLPFRVSGTVDSWNNIKKYRDVKGGFFIFDEQRVIGSGAWVKAFLKIAQNNEWILLSATPGDTWSDYIPVFTAHGYYRNRTEFLREHAVYARFAKFPKIIGWRNEARLLKIKHDILVTMNYESSVMKEHRTLITDYNRDIYRILLRERRNVWTDEPIVTASELCYCLRRVGNSDISRQEQILEILKEHPRAIIFYNYDYELDILKSMAYTQGTVIREWNGHRHQPIPTAERWVYIVQYTAGAEGWNCVTCDTMIFYSQNYSYKIMVQSAGRIDRRNTPFGKLYYFHLKSNSPIDNSISMQLKRKKDFNEKNYAMKATPSPLRERSLESRMKERSERN